MRKILATVLRWLYSHPIPRTAGHVISSIILGVLIAWFAADTIVSKKFVWKAVVETEATLYLAIYAVVYFFYYLGFYRFEHNLQKWNDPEYKDARMTMELWPDLVEAARKRVQEGDAINLEQLKQDMLK